MSRLESINSGGGGGASGVSSVNSLSGAVVLAAGTGVTLSPSGNTITIAAPGSGGTVTSASVVSANGLAGTVATATTTPAITLSTTVTGVLKGNGTAISAAAAGTDYQAPISTSSAPSHEFATGFTSPDTFTYAQPSYADISGDLPLSVTAPVTSTGGASPTIAMPASTNSVDGYLSAADHTTFAAKQPAGNYITALTGDGTASGPGSAAFTLSQAPNKVYVDFLSGSDSNTGSLVSPWKTLQHAYTTITPTINEPYVIYVSGGNNDSDSGTITGKPNVSVVADYPIQVNAITISGGTSNDGVTFTNLIFTGALTWVRNDNSAIGMTLYNCAFFSGPIFRQEGAGTAGIQAFDCTFVNSEFQLPGAYGVFSSCNFLGTTAFDDSGSATYAQITGGYSSSAMTIAGGWDPIYFAGVEIDVPFGASLTTSTTGSGTPVIQTDAGGAPPSISGPHTLNITAYAQYVTYTPSISGNWSPTPAIVSDALDQLAARVPVAGAQPTLSTSTAPSNQFGTGFTAPNTFTYAQPAFSNLSGQATLAQLPSIANNTILGNNSGITGVPIALTVAQVNTVLGDVLANGTVAFTADQSMGSHKLTNVTDPASAQDAATKSYVDSSVAALQPLASVYVATTGSDIPATYSNGTAGVGATLTTTATGVFTLDGVTPPLGARVLIKDQTSGFQNGVYSITTLGSIGVSTVFTRTLDYDTAGDMNAAGLIPVINGTLNALSSWQQVAFITTVGTDSLVFDEFTANPSLYLLKANNLSDVASANAAFDNISPMTTAGDIIYENATPTAARLAIGSTGNVLTVSGGLPVWAAPATNGTVTSVSVVSANGLAGTVATATTTPAITLSTTITGILQGNGTAISAATTGNLTDTGTDGITVTGGTGAVLGSGTSLSQHVADTTHNGYLSSTDWNTFNGKQAAGSYITALTGDATASGPGSVALTLATVNANVGTFVDATVTVNAKGLVTAVSGNNVVTKTTTYTAVAKDIVLGDATGGAFTVTLPAASSNANAKITVKKIDSSGNAVTVGVTGGDTIDGQSTQPISSQYAAVTVVSDGSNWYVIA